MGTWPGKFVKEMGIMDVSVMVYFSVDPVGAGIAGATEESGQDNIWCHINYTVYNKQLQFYYDDFGLIPEMLQIFYQNHIPVFVQNGEYFVQQGALMMVAVSDAKDQAPFAEETFAAILNGVPPRQLKQTCLP